MQFDGAILVAEDDPNDALLLQCAFTKTRLPGPIEFVSDGKEARDYLLGLGAYHDRHQFPFPAMLIVDLIMPRMNGFELLAWVRGNPELAPMFTVVLTGMDQQSCVDQACHLGINLYVVKPLQYSELSGVFACAAAASHRPPADRLIPAQATRED